MWAYNVPGRNPTICPVTPRSRASTVLNVASIAARIWLTGTFPASSQVVAWTDGGAWQAFRATGLIGPGGGGSPTAGRSPSSVTGVSLGVGVAVGFGVGVFVGAGVEVAVAMGVLVAGGNSSSSARLTEAGVGKIKER